VNIAAYVRNNTSRTNERVTHFGTQLGASLESREHPVECDLAIQAGFQISPAMKDAMERRIPIIILENPVWHYGDKSSTYTWGYNGLNNLGWAPPVPTGKARPHPPLGAWRDIDSGSKVIFGQVENDKALRGEDIYEWVEEMQGIYPDAEFREHPVMLDQRVEQEPFESVMERCSLAITYNSTVGAEAIIRGIITTVSHEGSWAYPMRGVSSYPRDKWITDLSWRHWSTDEDIDVDWILSGYDEALAQAQRGEYDNMSNGRDQ